VSLTDPEGITHSVTVPAESLFEAAAAAVTAFRQEGWAVDALTPAAVLRVEVQPPPISHDVPLRAVDRWLNAPTQGPQDRTVRRQATESGRRLSRIRTSHDNLDVAALLMGPRRGRARTYATAAYP
jgi:hypothetical protein